MADNPLSGLASDLGFGGAMLRDQTATETEEQRRKRMKQQMQGFEMPVPGKLSQLGPGTMSLMGGMSGRGY